MGIDVESYRARIGTFIRKNSNNGESEKRFRTAAKLRMIWIMKYCTSQVSDASPYWSVSWCSEHNCLPAYCYRGAIESDNYSLKPKGQMVPVVGRQAGKVLLMMVVASVLAIVHLLLVMSGDVEENPGPLGQHTKDPLDVQCCEEHLYKIAVLTFDWKMVGIRLVGAQIIRDIDREEHSEQNKRDKMLEKWLEIKGSKATYRVLIEALKDVQNIKAAEDVQKLVVIEAPPQSLPTIPVPALVESHNDDNCQTALKNLYSRKKTVAPDWPPVPKFTFINLALIKDTTEQHPQKHKFYLETIRGSVDDIIETKIAVDYENLFGGIENENVKPGTTILLEGRPGCGKTTLVKKLSRDWSEGKILGTVKYLFFVSLRKFYSTPIQDLNTILDTFDMQRLASDINSSFGKDICFIFDGLDEYSAPFTTSGCSWFEQLLRGEKLQSSLIFITSRPNASIDLRKCVTIRAEVLGFLEQHVMEYIDRSYADDITKAGEVKAYLKEHQSIRHMCYLPLHLVMVIFLYDNRKASTPLPKTETEVYTQFTIMTLRRYYDKKGRNQKVIGLAGVPEPEAGILKKICKLAYNRTAASRTDVSQYDIGDGASATEVETLGLLIVDEKDGVECSETAYSFPHLTNQEFLAAYYMSTLDPEEQLAAVKEHSVSPHMGVVLKFYCGLTKLENVDQWKAVLDNALLGQYSFEKKVNLNALHCIFESQNSHRCRELFSKAEGELAIRNETLTLTDYCAIGHCLAIASDIVTSITLECQLATEGLDIITQKLMSVTLNKVTTLYITDDLHDADKLLALKRFIMKLPFIENLSLSGCFKERGWEDWSLVEDILKECEHLKTLDFHFNNIGDSGIESFCQAAPHMSNLQYLDFSHNNIGDSGMELFSKAAPHMSNLQYLHFSHNNIGDSGIELFSKAAPHMSNLQTLSFGSNNIGDSGMESFSKAVPRMSNLQRLDFSDNNIGDSGIELFSKAAPHMSNLQELYFNRNNIGDSGIELFCQAAPHMSNLQTLHLGNTNVGDGSIESLIKIMTSCPLKILWLDNLYGDEWANHFSADAKDMLRAAAMSLEPERVIDLRVSEEDSNEEGLAPHPPVGPSDSEDEDYSWVYQLDDFITKEKTNTSQQSSSPPHPHPSASPSPGAGDL